MKVPWIWLFICIVRVLGEHNQICSNDNQQSFQTPNKSTQVDKVIRYKSTECETKFLTENALPPIKDYIVTLSPSSRIKILNNELQNAKTNCSSSTPSANKPTKYPDDVVGMVLISPAVRQVTITQDGHDEIIQIRGVIFDITIGNMLLEDGPYSYHIHELPMKPNETDCEATKGHFDPFNTVEKLKNGEHKCDENHRQYCQVGNLSGKYGELTRDDAKLFRNGTNAFNPVFMKTFFDPFSSLDSRNPAYIGNLSFVVHAPDFTRLACGNLVPL